MLFFVVIVVAVAVAVDVAVAVVVVVVVIAVAAVVAAIVCGKKWSFFHCSCDCCFLLPLFLELCLLFPKA